MSLALEAQVHTLINNAVCIEMCQIVYSAHLILGEIIVVLTIYFRTMEGNCFKRQE